jgi:hypothetical protein
MKVLANQPTDGRSDTLRVTFNYAVLSLVDELLWLPSASAAATAVQLLYGPASPLPEALLSRVGHGAPLSLATLVAAPTLLGTLVPSRLGPSGAWREGAVSPRQARALARDRYRDLQLALISGTAPRMASALSSLVRDTYGLRDHWHWTDGAKRILDRVVNLNRAALLLLAAEERARSRGQLEAHGPLRTLRGDLSNDSLDLLARALPPVAIPDFATLAAILPPGASPLSDESIDRYQSLFAEMLSLTGHPEARS